MKDNTTLVQRLDELLGRFDNGELVALVSEQPGLLEERCRVQREYFEGREKLRMPKDKDYTEWDRKTMLEASVAGLREEYEYVKGLEELVRDRVELYKLMLGSK